jgi:hypothetical protein
MLPEPDTERQVMIVINAREDTEGRLEAVQNYILWLLRMSGYRYNVSKFEVSFLRVNEN